MKLAMVLLAILGTAMCSLEPAGYRPPSSRYLPPTHSRPSPSYLTPSNTRTTPPRTSYGLPDYQAGHGQQQQYLKGNEQYEPARYDFGYQVRDDRGNDFGHQEARDGTQTRGSYYVLLPDGRRQIVEYVADDEGFKPRISYEASDARRSVAGGHSAYPGAPY